MFLYLGVAAHLLNSELVWLAHSNIEGGHVRTPKGTGGKVVYQSLRNLELKLEGRRMLAVCQKGCRPELMIGSTRFQSPNCSLDSPNLHL